MTRRKYINFILVGEDGGQYESSDWRSVFASYQSETSATIWGLPSYKGANYEVVMSK